MLAFLMGLIDPVARITQGIIDWQSKKITAQTDHEKIEADQNIAQLEAQRMVLVAEASTGSTLNMWVRLAASIPAIVILWKLEIWDRVLDWGSTPKLSVEEWSYIGMVTGFYLLNRTIQVAKK